MKRRLLVVVCALVLVFGLSGAAFALINLEWRPSQQTVTVGDSFTVGLYMKSDSAQNQFTIGMEVIMLWDPAYIDYQGLGPRQAIWDMMAGWGPWVMNSNLHDGDAFFNTMTFTAAAATPAGVLCQEFYFKALQPIAATYLTIPATRSGDHLYTTFVQDASIPNYNIVGTLGSDKITIATVLHSVAETKTRDDETAVVLLGPVVTRVFGTYFYVEDWDRTAGIKVNRATGIVPVEGQKPKVTGTIRTINGERVIDNAVVAPDSSGTIPESLTMTERSAHTLLPQGLLVRLLGIAHVPSGAVDMFTLSDGSPVDVRVELHGVSLPTDGKYYTAIGTLGADGTGPILRVNKLSDRVEIVH